jgi:hypothetical protein
MRLQNVSCFVLAAGLAAAVMLFSVNSASAAVCGEVWKPVCGTVDGQQRTFTNLCWAKAAKAKHIHTGACKWK